MWNKADLLKLVILAIGIINIFASVGLEAKLDTRAVYTVDYSGTLEGK